MTPTTPTNDKRLASSAGPFHWYSRVPYQVGKRQVYAEHWTYLKLRRHERQALSALVDSDVKGKAHSKSDCSSDPTA